MKRDEGGPWELPSSGKTSPDHAPAASKFQTYTCGNVGVGLDQHIMRVGTTASNTLLINIMSDVK